MDDLAERIKASLEDPSIEPWFPELTDELTAREWDRLHRDIGLTPDTYATARVLSRSITAPRNIITPLRTSSSAGAPTIAIEALSPEWVMQYSEAGVSFYSRQEILNGTVLTCLEAALLIVNQVPSLMRTVASLVRSFHIIKAEDADYDVSFSEPQLPFSIFVSVPEERIANDALRVAEAIVHEAMHLQLTLVERILTLVSSTDGKYMSPWQREYRNAQGVLHAIYVFRVIDRFLKELSSSDCYDLASHMAQRRREIADEMGETLSFQDCSELTPTGSSFIRHLL